METDNLRARCRWWLPLFLLLLIAAVSAGGLALTRSGPASFDEPLLLWFRAEGHSGQVAGPEWGITVWRSLTWLGNTTPRIIVAGLTVLWLLGLRRGHGALFLAGLLVSGIVLSETLKHGVDRPRPQVVTHLDRVVSPSFPSGHALNSTLFFFAVALLVGRLLRARGARWSMYAAAAGLSLAIGLSRLALGVHYPTDVLAGWVLGGAWLGLWFAVARNYWPKALA